MIIAQQLSSETWTCADCGKPFQRSTMIFTKALPPDKRMTRCDACADILNVKAAASEAAQQLERRWHDVCPPLYRDTDCARLHPRLASAADKWEYQPRAMGFVGYAGCGKTRAAFLLLKKMFYAGHYVEAVSAVRFAKLSADQFADDKGERAESRRLLDRFHKRELLLLDDLGKERFTERTQTEMFELLEYRTSNLLPTIWTANASGSELQKMFSPDKGEPILRRLSEFSEIIIVK